MRDRVFFIPRGAIKPDVAPGHGSCVATDRITVDGQPVGFMYREEPDSAVDSGWRFFVGDESQEYVDDADNMALYDVNTIVNYDADIVPLLGAPCGSAFERSGASGEFVRTEFPGDPDEEGLKGA